MEGQVKYPIDDIRNILIIGRCKEMIAPFCQMIITILGAYAKIETVATPDKAIDLLFGSDCGPLSVNTYHEINKNYDLVFMELNLADPCEIGAYHAIAKIAKCITIIVLIHQNEQDKGVKALNAGAADYIVEDNVTTHLLIKSFNLALRNKKQLSRIHDCVKKLKDCQEHFYSIVQKSTDGVMVVENSGRIVFFNSAAMEQFKLSQEQLIGNLFGQPAIPGDMTEVDILRQDNSNGVAEMRSVKTTWNSKPADLILLRDITARIKAEEQILRNEKLAALGKLAGILGHEIRSPLGVLKNSIEFIKLRLQQKQDEKLKKHLRIMTEEIEIINKTIGDILYFARTKAPEYADTDLNNLIRATLKMINIPDGIQIVDGLAPGITRIAVDAAQISRAFKNLFSNALEAMPNGGILTIGSRLTKNATHEKYIDFWIKDTGMGIPQNILEKIAEPLFTTKSKGTGLGLAASKNAINAHGGTIKIESSVGKGTKILIRLPACVGRNNK